MEYAQTHEDDKELIWPILEALGKIASEALGKIGSEEAIRGIIAVLDGNWDDSLMEKTLSVLIEVGDPAVEPLKTLLENHDKQLHFRELVLEALGKIASEESIKDIINMLGTNLGGKAFSVLKGIGEPAVDSLIVAMDKANENVKIEIIKILGEIGDKKATDPLIFLFEKEKNKDIWNSDVVNWALYTLGRLKDPKEVMPLINAIKYDTLGTDNNYPLQCCLIMALGEIGDKRAIKPLIRLMLENDQSSINYSAAFSIAKIGVSGCDDKLVEQIISIMENTRREAYIRNWMAWTLLKTDKTITALPLINYLKSNFMPTLKVALQIDSGNVKEEESN